MLEHVSYFPRRIHGMLLFLIMGATIPTFWATLLHYIYIQNNWGGGIFHVDWDIIMIYYSYYPPAMPKHLCIFFLVFPIGRTKKDGARFTWLRCPKKPLPLAARGQKWFKFQDTFAGKPCIYIAIFIMFDDRAAPFPANLVIYDILATVIKVPNCCSSNPH